MVKEYLYVEQFWLTILAWNSSSELLPVC